MVFLPGACLAARESPCPRPEYRGPGGEDAFEARTGAVPASTEPASAAARCAETKPDSGEAFDVLHILLPELGGIRGATESSPAPELGESSSRARTEELSDGAPAPQHVQWKPLLLQSLNFLLVEHGFRYAQQWYLRRLTLHKPFWYDYFKSLEHTDLSHWGDGDNSLTNYVGHPIEGAVTGYIWIQDDPAARTARFGSGAYWRSRIKATGWAALYSLQFEEGPVLSEAALGNQGGFYFVPGCGPAPCSKPGKEFKPPTVGTGWVDFVITPTVGLAWILMEDTISAKLMPRLAGDDPSLAWRFLGAVLTPSHSMASFMAGRLPWARNSEPGAVRAGSTQKKAEAGVETEMPRLETGVHYVSLNLPMDSESCNKCRTVNSGVGGVFAYRLSRTFWFDSELNYFPGSGSGGKGSTLQGLFGVRYGLSRPRWGAYVKMRPGFIAYERAFSYPDEDELRSLTRFAFDAGAVLEYRPSVQEALRLDVGSTFVRYLQGLDPKQPAIGWISSDYYTTQGNFQVAVGYMRRF